MTQAESIAEIDDPGTVPGDPDAQSGTTAKRRFRVKWFIGRVIAIPISLFVVVSLSFGIVNLSPGDPARVVAGPVASDAQVAQTRAQLGLDGTFMERYVSYVSGLVRGDLGRSYYNQRPVVQELRERLPNTIELVAPALLVALLLGMILGIIAGYFQSRAVDRTTRVVISATQSVPDFLAGLIFIYIFFAALGVAPSPLGRFSLMETPPPHITGFQYVDAVLAGDWSAMSSLIAHAVLPTLALGIVYSAYFAKTTRSVLREELSSKYVEFARASGLRERTVLKYALLVGRTKILTYTAILFGGLVGGTAIIEKVFSWPGAGAWGLEAMMKLDIPVIQGFILFVGVVTLVTFLGLDIIVGLLDPRISRG